jgi:hypothetical protein
MDDHRTVTEENISMHVMTMLGLVLSLLAFSACGPGSPDGEMTGQDTPMPDLGQAESLGDPDNCGELGLNCIGPLGLGSCVDGQCGPTLSQCYNASGTCAEICALEGRACAPLGCDGATGWGWTASSVDEATALCGLANHQTVEPMYMACDDELEGLAQVLSCCCSNEG